VDVTTRVIRVDTITEDGAAMLPVLVSGDGVDVAGEIAVQKLDVSFVVPVVVATTTSVVVEADVETLNGQQSGLLFMHPTKPA
jgi:hypothetical protein